MHAPPHNHLIKYTQSANRKSAAAATTRARPLITYARTHAPRLFASSFPSRHINHTRISTVCVLTVHWPLAIGGLAAAAIISHKCANCDRACVRAPFFTDCTAIFRTCPSRRQPPQPGCQTGCSLLRNGWVAMCIGRKRGSERVVGAGVQHRKRKCADERDSRNGYGAAAAARP